MSKIYCVHCGKENNDNKEKCKYCNHELNSKDHLWKDYIYDHIKDDLKGKVTDKTIALITNFIKSHMYGTIMTILIVGFGTIGVIKSTTNNFLDKVSSSSDIAYLKEISLASEEVIKAHEIVTINYDLILEDYDDIKENDEGFYIDKYVDYNSFSNKTRLYLTTRISDIAKTSYDFTNCDGIKDYANLYNWCKEDISGSGLYFGEDYVSAMGFYKIDGTTLETNYHNIWGDDKKINHEDFIIKYNSSCEYSRESNDYLCYMLPEGWPAIPQEITKMIKAETIKDTMYLYDYYVTSSDSGTFKDKYLTKKISDIDYKEIYFANKEDMSILKKGQVYKHTFKKNRNGTFYWVSSTPVELDLN